MPAAAGTALSPTFLALDQAALLASLSRRHLAHGYAARGVQMAAWRGEYDILGDTLREIVDFERRGPGSGPSSSSTSFPGSGAAGPTS